MENSESENRGPLTPDIRLKILKGVNELFRTTNSSPININDRGLIESTRTAELIGKLASVDITLAEIGNVVWWITDNSNNYFLVESVDKIAKSLNGSFASFKKDGEEGRNYDAATLLGSGIKGGLLVPGELKKGLPVEMSISNSLNPDIPPKHYWSSPTTGIGIINENLSTPTP